MLVAQSAEYKLAEPNFFGRTHPVILGLDLSGIIVAKGDQVKDFAVGDEVMAMAAFNGDGGWAVGGRGGYGLAREFLTIETNAEIARLAGAKGIDLVFDSTYSETSFVNTAKTLRQGGTWVVLGVGPGKTTCTVDTDSPVDAILVERGAGCCAGHVCRVWHCRKTRSHPEASKERHP